MLVQEVCHENRDVCRIFGQNDKATWLLSWYKVFSFLKPMWYPDIEQRGAVCIAIVWSYFVIHYPHPGSSSSSFFWKEKRMDSVFGSFSSSLLTPKNNNMSSFILDDYVLLLTACKVPQMERWDINWKIK